MAFQVGNVQQVAAAKKVFQVIGRRLTTSDSTCIESSPQLDRSFFSPTLSHVVVRLLKLMLHCALFTVLNLSYLADESEAGMRLPI